MPMRLPVTIDRLSIARKIKRGVCRSNKLLVKGNFSEVFLAFVNIGLWSARKLKQIDIADSDVWDSSRNFKIHCQLDRHVIY